MITCSDISCIKGFTTLFQNLNITLDEGDSLAIVGRNGLGKTTLLRVIAGLTKPYTGDVKFRGNAIYSDIASYHSSIAYIGTKSICKAQLTVWENMYFIASIYGHMELVLPAMHFFGITAFADLPYELLSSGWQQRVTLSILLMTNSAIWILDEPTSHLDEDACKILMELINVRCARRGIVIVATHDTHVIKCSKILDLQNFVI